MPKNKKTIWIIDKMHKAILDAFPGHNLIYSPDLEKDEFFTSSILTDVEVLLLRSKLHLTSAHIETMPKLKLIGRSGSGMDNIDVKAAEDRGIICVNAPEGNRNAVGEHALGMLLNLSNHMTSSFEEVKRGVWDREGNRGFELEGKTIGIYGYGNTGSRFAELLAPFGARVMAYDKYKSGFGNEHVQESNPTEIFNHADVISFHIPLTKETHAIISKDFVNRVQKPFVLLNTSRGKIMNTKDVIEGLKNGKIMALGTDVLENEKLTAFSQEEKNTFDELVRMSNVLVTPHVAGWTRESYRKLSVILAQKVNDILDNERAMHSSDKHKIL
jgi:D-3-phosphoglycerate dehydrogenase